MDLKPNEYRLFTIVVEGAHCGGCNWESSHQYVLAKTEEEARQLYEDGEAGLCGDCMCDMIVEAGYLVANPNLKDALQVQSKEIGEFDRQD